jgi:hypothetical protein
VPSPGRSETKNRNRPITGVGQKSAHIVLMGSPRFLTSPQGASMLVRSAAQISLAPSEPNRGDAMKIERPSSDSIGQPSACGEFSAGTVTAVLHLA